jgi:hypothetical protein
MSVNLTSVSVSDLVDINDRDEMREFYSEPQ